MRLTHGAALFLAGLLGMLLSAAGGVAVSVYFKRARGRLKTELERFYRD